MKLFFFLFFVLGLISALIVANVGTGNQLKSFTLGEISVFINVLLLSLGWRMIFQKKFIALAIGVIVFKYAILGIFVYQVIKIWNLSAKFFCLGFSILLPVVLVYGFLKSRFDKN